MFAVVLIGLSLITAQTGKTAGLPATPQGRHLEAFIEAFNSGDEAKYLAMMEQHVAPELLKKRPAAEHVELFQRMKADFGTSKFRGS